MIKYGLLEKKNVLSHPFFFYKVWSPRGGGGMPECGLLEGGVPKCGVLEEGCPRLISHGEAIREGCPSVVSHS